MLFELGEDELQTLLEMLKYLLLGTNVFLFLTAALVFFTSSTSENSASLSPQKQFKRALIVTAHPDDESMFFLPLVHSLQQQEGSSDVWQTHLLCLSRGNFDGLGDIRDKELKACATYIGLSTDHVKVLEDPKLQDGMKNHWDVAHVAAIVATYADEHKIDAIFTFDDYGVSGHANHIATHYGVKRAVQELHEKCSAAAEGAETKVVRGWALESTNVLRKYTGLLDTALSFWLLRRKEEEKDESQFVFLFRPRWNYNAMALHQSQFVWYRRLFVAFSRYTFINTFRPLSGGKADLPAEQKKMQ